MERLVDVFLLNLLWLLCCLPLVTIGASTVAAYSVTLKMVDNEEGYLAKTFFKAFKQNFIKSTLLWLINAVILYALYLDWQLVKASPNPSFLLIFAGIIIAGIAFCAFIYAYPLMARYENSLLNTLRNSFQISIRYLGRTLILVLIVAFEVAVFSWNTTMLLFGIIIAPMIMIYTISGVSRGIFKRIEDPVKKK
jgi:uncharacterized membrane protein YesL